MDHPMIERIQRTGYPYRFCEEVYECEVCGRELIEEADVCPSCEDEEE
ncbi:hypothetical protein [Cytobacillus firmus]|nr:hypothetical protein [Cytobacillus firmus]MED1942104.1 hypothetical protein [Cytobacillus firmus]